MPIWGRCSFFVTIFLKKLYVIGIAAVLVSMISIHIYFRGSRLRGAVASFFSYIRYFIKCVFRVRCLVLCVIVIALVERVPKWVYWLSC